MSQSFARACKDHCICKNRPGSIFSSVFWRGNLLRKADGQLTWGVSGERGVNGPGGGQV